MYVGKAYTAEENEFIKQYAPGHSRKEIIAAFKERFDYELTIGQLKARMKKLNVQTGFTGRFGTFPAYNKGKRLTERQYNFAEPTMFKKGNVPKNRAEVGTEVLMSDGYVKVKVAQPRTWKRKHVFIWEQENGDLPKDKMVIFLDQNKQNFDPSNLVAITKQTNLVLERNHMLTNDPVINKTMILIAEYMASAKIGTFDAIDRREEIRIKKILKERKR
jgi:hypothetical protein